MGEVVLCRHGSTKLNLGALGGERVRSWLDVPLDTKGREEAADLAGYVANKYKVGIIYSSDLLRAFQTSEFIADRTNGSIAPSTGLRTQNMGELSGMLVSEALPKLQFYDANPTQSPANGESKQHFISRYEADLWELLNEVRHSKYGGVLMTHARCLSVTPGILADSSRQIPFQSIPFTGALAEIRPASKGRYKMVLLKRGLREALSHEIELSEPSR